jgi:pimeloyl-ACP methyl ester carboxylesterase
MKPAYLSLARAYCWRKSSPHLVDGAGHWVQQEQPERVSELLLQFLRDSAKS